jgi:hypothetical protein
MALVIRLRSLPIVSGLYTLLNESSWSYRPGAVEYPPHTGAGEPRMLADLAFAIIAQIFVDGESQIPYNLQAHRGSAGIGRQA